MVRIHPDLYHRLLRASTTRTLKEGKPVTVNRLVVEAIERSLN